MTVILYPRFCWRVWTRCKYLICKHDTLRSNEATWCKSSMINRTVKSKESRSKSSPCSCAIKRNDCKRFSNVSLCENIETRSRWNSRRTDHSRDLRGKRRKGRRVPARSAGQHSKTIVRHVFCAPGDISLTVTSTSTVYPSNFHDDFVFHTALVYVQTARFLQNLDLWITLPCFK